MHKELTGIRVPGDKDSLWKYMSFEKFVSLLSTKTLFFTRSDKFDDPFEGFTPPSVRSIYQYATNRLEKDDLKMSAKSQGTTLKLLENWRKYVMCSCWHHSDEESMAMWEKYHMHNGGIAIKTTVEDFKNCWLGSNDVFIGKIEYINHYKYPVPQNLSEMSMIYTWYFHKRKAFEYEQEFRAIVDAHPFIKDFFEAHGNSVNPHIILNNEFPDICDVGMSFNVDVENFISEVITSPYTDDWITETIRSVVNQYGFNFEVNSSTLLDTPE